MSNKTDYASSLGQKIQTCRTKKKLNQAQLAEKAAVSASFLCEIEKGLKVPGVDVAQRIASALQIDIRKLLPAA